MELKFALVGTCIGRSSPIESNFTLTGTCIWRLSPIKPKKHLLRIFQKNSNAFFEYVLLKSLKPSFKDIFNILKISLKDISKIFKAFLEDV